MELKFNSAICTSMEQSERLLALGLKKETADCQHLAYTKDSRGNSIPKRNQKWFTRIGREESVLVCGFMNVTFIPAWSLHRLLSMLTYQVIYNGAKYEPVIALDGMAYQDVCSDDPIVGWSGDLYTDVIDCIKWLISIEQFNTEYLEE